MTYSKLKQGESIPFHGTLSIQFIRQQDLADIINMLNDEQVNQYLYFAPADDSLFQAFFAPIIDEVTQAIEKRIWPANPTFVIRDQSGQYMGMTAVTQVMFLEGNFEIGYQLPVHAWQQGIATSACRLMTEIGFEQLKAHKISADCYAANIGSYKTLEKCGYQREGCQSAYYKLKQGFDDKLYYGMTAEQFRMLK